MTIQKKRGASMEPQKERGAAAVLVAASLILLMGMAAVALDGGRGFNERRQAQSGVDFAALGALLAATECDDSGCGNDPAQEGALEAIAIVDENLPGRGLNLAAWTACTDPNRPAGYVASPISPCVSFTQAFGQARVVLPPNALPTTFGRVLGANSIEVGAFAEAGQFLNTSSQVIPLTLAGTGSSACLFSNQSPQTVPPCDGPSNGNFGYLDIALHDAPFTCEQGTANDRTALNLARGSDHSIVAHKVGDPVVNDHAVCPNLSEDVNELEVKTGSPSGGLTDGLISGISGSINGQPIPAHDGRLTCTGVSGWGCVTVRGTSLDDTPLWQFLNSAHPLVADTGEACNGVATHDEMLTCLDAWETWTPPPPADPANPDPIPSLFVDGLRDHPRFVAVPVFTIYPTQGASGSYLVQRFAPVYLETLYIACNANSCRTVHTPGTGNPPGTATCPAALASNTYRCGLNSNQGQTRVEGLTGFQLKFGMLPASITDHFPGVAGARTTLLLK